MSKVYKKFYFLDFDAGMIADFLKKCGTRDLSSISGKGLDFEILSTRDSSRDLLGIGRK